MNRPAMRGFARIRCPSCRAEYLLAFSCRTRDFCPSCQARRSALLAHVVTQILEPVPHRHVVLTIPGVLRGLFQRERRLLGLLARAAGNAIVPSVRAILDRHDVTPGLVLSIQTFDSYAANFHPHGHALVTDGAFTEEGGLLQLPYFDARLVEKVEGGRSAGTHPRPHHPDPGPRSTPRRLLRLILDPLLCPASGSAMTNVSVITEPTVMDAILAHIAGPEDWIRSRGAHLRRPERGVSDSQQTDRRRRPERARPRRFPAPRGAD